MSHKGTPLIKVKREEAFQKEKEQEIKTNLERFRCEIHPQFKIDALKVRSGRSINLLCIKCIIDGDADCNKEQENDQLITISELLHNCSNSILKKNTNVMKSRDSLQNRFTGYLTKEYPQTYERILENQYKHLNDQITELKAQLELVREKYRDYYQKEIDMTREQGHEIKVVIDRLIHENPEENKEQFSSIDEIYEQINTLDTNDDFLGFLQDLYLKSNKNIEDVTDSDECRRLLEGMEELKRKTENVMHFQANLPNYEETKQNIESLLQEDSVSFKKSIGIHNRGKKLEFENRRAFEELEHNYSAMHLEVPYEHSEPSYSPRSRGAQSTVTKVKSAPRNVDSMEKTVKKRKEKLADTLNSQSLRNLKKELEKKNEDERDPKMGKNKLIDWINRRLTGYLIFQNTIKDSGMKDKGISETGTHLNNLTGNRWKALTEREKEDYKRLANHYRSIFKRDVEEHNTENEGDLLEQFDEKIKKIKLM